MSKLDSCWNAGQQAQPIIKASTVMHRKTQHTPGGKMTSVKLKTLQASNIFEPSYC